MTGTSQTREFVRAWYEWQRVALPVDSFRQGRTSSPTMDLEHDLDHMRSYVHDMGSAFLNEGRVTRPERVDRHLEALLAAEEQLTRLELPGEVSEPYSKFIRATRSLLLTLRPVVEQST
jgi:hypothetical protein